MSFFIPVLSPSSCTAGEESEEAARWGFGCYPRISHHISQLKTPQIKSISKKIKLTLNVLCVLFKCVSKNISDTQKYSAEKGYSCIFVTEYRQNTAILPSPKGLNQRITHRSYLRNCKTSEKGQNVLTPVTVQKGALYMTELEKCQGTSTQISAC